MKNHIIISLLILSVGFGQQIITTETYENGNVKSITYHKKTRDGIQRVKEEGYHEKGEKEFEGSYKDGKPDGLTTTWYENGQKKSEGNYKGVIRYGFPIKDGKWTEWYENGQKKEELTVRDDKLDGLFTRWYENGQKESEETYKDGEIVELIGKWNRDGSVDE